MTFYRHDYKRPYLFLIYLYIYFLNKCFLLLFWNWIVCQSHVRQWQQARAVDLATAEALQRKLLGDRGQMAVIISEPNFIACNASFMIKMSLLLAVNAKHTFTFFIFRHIKAEMNTGKRKVFVLSQPTQPHPSSNGRSSEVEKIVEYESVLFCACLCNALTRTIQLFSEASLAHLTTFF